jgi:SPP1 gp7 family putative phage head morphogenesis protein
MARINKIQAAMPLQARAILLRSLKAALSGGRQECRAEADRGPQKHAGELPTYDPEAALSYLEAKTDFLVTGLSTKLTEVVRNELLFGLRNGAPFTETRNRLLDALALWVGAADADLEALRPDRLLTTVRTNVTDAYNQGRVIEARRLGKLGIVKGMQHSSVLDRVTTDICRHLQGKVYRIDDPLLDTFTPPLHFRCLAAGVLVGTDGPVLAKSAREYRGEMITIRTRGGKELAGTPNHPVLTDRGWVALGLLNEGDGVVCRAFGQDALGVQVDDQNVPALIEDVAVAPLSASGVLSVVVPSAAEDFHGDGAGSEVSIVSADGLLWRRLHAARAKHLLELLLVGAAQPRPGVAFSGLGDLDPVLVSLRGWAVSHGLMSRRGLLAATFLAELGHAQNHGISAPAKLARSMVISMTV